MQLIDLTHRIHPGMTVYPGTAPPVITEACTLAADGFREKRLDFYSHTGTHIDAPAHMLANGKSLDQLPIGTYFGTAWLYRHHGPGPISTADLAPGADRLGGVDFLLIATGWEKFWKTPAYFTDFPTLTEEAAHWLSQFRLKGVGVDTISVDPVDSLSFPVHTVLLTNEIVIIENLTNLSSLTVDTFSFGCLPLHIEDADGSPVRAVALIDD